MSNRWRDFEKVVKPVFLIATLLGLLFFAWAKEAKGDMHLELGAPFLSGEFAEGATLMVEERRGRWGCGMTYITEQRVRPRNDPPQDLKPNLGIHCLRYATLGDRDQWEFGVGPAYWNSTNRALGSKFNAGLSVAYKFNEKWALRVRHYSNAGSASPNMGQDILTLAYSF